MVEIETKIKANIYQKGVEKKITDLTSRVNQVLKSKSNQKSQITALKKELLEFISSSNVYYSKQKKTAEKLLIQLENHSALNNEQKNISLKPKTFPVKIVIPFLLVGLLIVVLIILTKKRKK